MSWNPILDPSIPIGDAVDAIETVIVPRARDLGGFEVRRALPSVQRQMVGPFIFFDQMGPAEFLTGQGIDVRAHPHIGLATVTYLLKGKMHHRDSLGTDPDYGGGGFGIFSSGGATTHVDIRSYAGHELDVADSFTVPESRSDYIVYVWGAWEMEEPQTEVTATVTCQPDEASPSITSVEPASGTNPGGTPVTIKGANLSGATALKIGGREATDLHFARAHRLDRVLGGVLQLIVRFHHSPPM